MKRLGWTVLSLAALTTACDRGMSAGTLARAGGHDLTVTQTANLLAPEAGIPNQPDVVMAVADLWIDYTLLATAVNEDSTLKKVDLKPLVDQQEEVEMIGQLRDKAIKLDTALTDQEVQQAFAKEGPGVRVHARHILLSPPEGATQVQRDSVKQLAQDLIKRIKGGEKFEDLAKKYSQDPGSAAKGGDLGFFDRGQMVAQFDSAAFSLEPGQMSDVVATPFGYHIIQVQERQTPGFDEVGPQFRQQLQMQKVQKAESLFVAGLETKNKLQIQDKAAANTREVAKNPMAKMGGSALGRALVKYDGGELTVGELREFLQTREPGFREQVQQATDQQITDNLLKALTQRELLVKEAQAQGIKPNTAREDSMTTVIRSSFVDAAKQLGLVGIKPNEGESQKQAIDRTVTNLLQSILKGQRDVIPLGGVSFTLRRQYDAEVNQPAVEQVVTQVTSIRGPGAGGLPGMPGMPQMGPGEPGAGGAPAPEAPQGQPQTQPAPGR
jgi:hypothetical protein